MKTSTAKWKTVNLGSVCFGSVFSMAGKYYIHLSDGHMIDLNRGWSFRAVQRFTNIPKEVRVLELDGCKEMDSTGTSFLRLAQYIAENTE